MVRPPEASKFTLPDGRNPNDVVMYSGGGAEGAAGGIAAQAFGDPCTLPATSCYSDPVGLAPHPQLINGQFNMQEFAMADEFIPSASGTVEGLCWSGSFGGSTSCNVLKTPPARYTITYYPDTGTGLPDITAPIAVFQNDSLYGDIPAGPAGPAPTEADIAQGQTGEPVGFGGPFHIRCYATHSPVAVVGGTCYWVEIFYLAEAGIPCFWQMSMSYESHWNGVSFVGEGNRRSQRVDRNTGNDFDFPFYVNLDMAMCIEVRDGLAAIVPLSDTNAAACGSNATITLPRGVPANDEATGAIAAIDGAIGTDFDMTYSTYNTALGGGPSFALFPCRKPTVDPEPYEDEAEGGDIWYSMVPDNTTAQFGICGTNQLGGSPMGDSMIELWQRTDQTMPPTLANLVRVGGTCNDDACGTQSDNCVSGLVIARTYYARIGAFQPASKGILRFNFNSPCPPVPNDFCSGAFDIPANSGGVGYATALGILLTGQTRTATVDGLVQNCAGTPHTSRSVWYKLAGPGGGNGNRILLTMNQAPPGTTYNNTMSVYCSDDNTCTNLNCVATNNNKQSQSGGEIDAEIEFCARAGKTYYIQIFGNPTAPVQGDFALLAVALRDGSDNIIECCDVQQCAPACSYQLSQCQNPLDESTDFTAGHQMTGGYTIAASEPCVVGNTAANRLNDGCTFDSDPAAATVLRSLGYIPGTGYTVTGTTWSDAGFRDQDWYIIRQPNFAYVDPLPAMMDPQPQNNITNRSIFDWAFQAQGPMYLLWRSLSSNFKISHQAACAAVTPAGCRFMGPCTPASPLPCAEACTSPGVPVGCVTFCTSPGVPVGCTPVCNPLTPTGCTQDTSTFGCVYTGTFQGNWGFINHTLCGEGAIRRGITEHMPASPDPAPPNSPSGIRSDGTPVLSGGAAGYGEMACHAQFFNLVTLPTGSGYDCAKAQRYWTRINGFTPVNQCDALADPAGVAGTDFDDETILATFDGSAGADGVLIGEACLPQPISPGILTGTPTDDTVGGKDGCFAVPVTDGDFFPLRLNIPMMGRQETSVNSTSGASTDLDFYKFEITEPSVVRVKMVSPFAAFCTVSNNNCDVDSTTYFAAGTSGSCGPRSVDIEDEGILQPGIYILSTAMGDSLFPGGGQAFAPVDCSDTTSRYRIDVLAEPIPGCTPTCPGGSVVENEPCGTEANTCTSPTNNGCTQAVFAATALGAGFDGDLCGSLYSNYQMFPDATSPFQGDTFFGDIDYFTLTVAGGTRRRVTISSLANAPTRVQIIETGTSGDLCPRDLGDAPLRVLVALDADQCGGEARGVATSKTVFLDAGTYSIVVAPGTVDVGRSFADYDCVFSNTISYSVNVDSAAVGSCCDDTDCLLTTAGDCPGTFTANDTCGDGYDAVGGCSAFATISGSVAAISPNLTDEEVRTFPVAPFTLRGVSYSQVGVSSNGFLVFGSTENSPIARNFPNTALPNAVVAPLWYDWDPSATGSEIYITTTGGLGNEVTTVEWNNVAGTSDWSRRANFQAVLFHSSGDIEFRYGSFTDLCEIDRRSFGIDAGQTASAGIEGAAATAGDGINHVISDAFLASAGGACQRFAASTDGNPCAVPPCCLGNASKVPGATINFSQILIVLANFGNPSNPNGTSVGDANCDGSTNFTDVLVVLAEFGELCP